MLNFLLKKYSLYLYNKERLKNKIESQEKTLFNIIKANKNTKFYYDNNLNKVNSIKTYQENVKLRSYEDFYEEYFKKYFPNLDKLTYKNKINYFAESSGTTSGITKYIPVSKNMHKANIKASLIALGSAYTFNKSLNIKSNNFLYLGSSTNLKALRENIFTGDLSGIAAHLAPFYLKHFTYPNAKLSNIVPWQAKIDAIIKDSINKDICGISGTPPWVLIFLENLLKFSNKNYLYEIWPNFKLFIYGGVSINNYLNNFNNIFYNLDLTYLEIYPSSEGFIAYKDFNSNLLKLIINNNIFYEFVPIHELNKDNPIRHSVVDLEENIDYAIILTNNSGLWSYILGDTIKFICKNNLLFKITGRTKYYLSSFGEHISFEEIENVLKNVSDKYKINILEYHIAPIFNTDSFKNGRHIYILEFDNVININKEVLIKDIDLLLKEKNKDYKAYRDDNRILEPELIIVDKGFFSKWMKSINKQGGQYKVPKVDNDAKVLQSILNLIKN